MGNCLDRDHEDQKVSFVEARSSARGGRVSGRDSQHIQRYGTPRRTGTQGSGTESIPLRTGSKQPRRQGTDSITASKLRRPEGVPKLSLAAIQDFAANPAMSSARYHGRKDRKLRHDYEVLEDEVLGEGCTGKVLTVKSRIDGRRYALKKVNFGGHEKELRSFIAEVEIYLSIDHPNIVRLHNVYETSSYIALVTELCEGGVLYKRLASKNAFTEPDAKVATVQMLRAIAYLHEHNIVHRDLKLDNFLYESNDEAAQLKLIDFGFAKVWDPSTKMMATVGSMAYVSPDVLLGDGYTSKCDLWSLGVIVFILLCGIPPFTGGEHLMKKSIVRGQVDCGSAALEAQLSAAAQSFLRGLLVVDPALRMDAASALEHEWLQSMHEGDATPCLGSSQLQSLEKYAQSSRVRRAVLQVLAQELEPTAVEGLRQTFLSLDTARKGTVSLTQLKQAIRNSRSSDEPQDSQSFPSKLRRANSGELDSMLGVLDVHGDDRIYYSDFLAATIETRAKIREETLAATFHRLDADGSGAITAADIRKVFGDTFEGVAVDELLKEVDPEGKFTFEAFKNLLLEDSIVIPDRCETRTDPLEMDSQR
eukprot:CAMPEP_0178392084 /NCGR_PEP_ID=MMETSP0689_2-20121128/11497_1 /TAXON_ID=160604 /ORGANISM="Amphidinium massartii, Strain CS-259" /LENGTH=590 /DNA_ID=CAMNT_0020012649 /DNA_START=96 /DNA_END=1865 /DNA_ORIENTATION=-